MTRIFLSILALGFAFACGSTPEATNATEYPGIVNGNTLEENDAEFAQLGEAISVGTGGMGFAVASNQLRCAQPGGAGNNCYVPLAANKANVTYCFSGFTGPESQGMHDAIEQVDAQTTWNFSEVGFPCDLSIQNATISGSSAANVENYVKFQPSGTVGALTSPAGVSHVNGTWQSFTKAIVVVDIAKLNANATVGFRPMNYAHFGAHIAALYMGLGTQQDAVGVNFGSRRAVSLTASVGFNSGLAAGEVCRANNTTTGTFNQISATTNCAAF